MSGGGGWVGMLSSMWFISLCSIANQFVMQVKDINSVGPRLGYEEQYSKQILIIMYNTFDTL